MVVVVAGVAAAVVAVVVVAAAAAADAAEADDAKPDERTRTFETKNYELIKSSVPRFCADRRKFHLRRLDGGTEAQDGCRSSFETKTIQHSEGSG
jgi:hypothetical protein